ncbi:MAG: SRPBCC domain-containing protein [Chitinophagaceae bacterium]
MIINKQANFTKDVAKKTITVDKDFDAPLEDVWRAWTESELLDQWWGPKPWKAVTKSMDFREGGHWQYAMVGPDGDKQWCREEFKAIVKHKSISFKNAFCDEQGNINNSFPVMQWKAEFLQEGDTTKVVITITFSSEEELNTIVEMGFQEGFTAGLGNLDELLAK